MASIRRLRLALLSVILVWCSGCAGYVIIEKWHLGDAIYMTAITCAGVGFSEVHPLSPAGRAFTILLILTSVVASLVTAASFADFLIGEALRDTLELHRRRKGLKKMDNHVIICGYGRMGRELASEFRRRRQRFVVIEVSEARCRELREAETPFVHGNAADDANLIAAGVERAVALVTVVPKDADNVFITLSARALNAKIRIIARSESEPDVHKLEIAGADRVVSPYIIGAQRIASVVTRPAVADFVDETCSAHGVRWEMHEVGIPERSILVGVTLEQSGIAGANGCVVLAIREAGSSSFQPNPPRDQLLRGGDTLIVLGTPEQLVELEKRVGR